MSQALWQALKRKVLSRSPLWMMQLSPGLCQGSQTGEEAESEHKLCSLRLTYGGGSIQGWLPSGDYAGYINQGSTFAPHYFPREERPSLSTSLCLRRDITSFPESPPPSCHGPPLSICRNWSKKMKVLATQSCPTLCNPMDCSLPVSSVQGIFQARLLEWAAMPSSGGSSWLRDPFWASIIAGRLFTIWATRDAYNWSCPFLIPNWTSLVAQTVKRLPTLWETWVRSLGQEDSWRRK